MSREIKFRAYNAMVKKMLHFADPIGIADDVDRYGMFLKSVEGKMYIGGDYEIMQFTGLHDQKRTDEYPDGQPIYEGDIFKDHFSDKSRGVVKFGEYRNPWMDDGFGGHVGFYIDWLNDEGLNRKDLAYWVKVSQVIGNVFENPELIDLGTAND